MTDQTPIVQRDGVTDVPGVDELDVGEGQHLLSNPVRRAVLAVLAQDASTMTLTDLAAEIAAAGTDATGDVDRQTLAVCLHHNHLPRLAAAGLLEYDSKEKSVRPRPERLSVFG
jgi:allophanate hydrolase subunit 2